MWNTIIEGVTKANNFLNDIVWGWPVIILILGTGILLTVMTRFLQIRKFKASLDETIIPTVKSIGRRGNKKDKSSVSQFEAFSTAISGTVGTGNIIGVTSAILTGGPGAVFWMWISAFFGMVTNYSENVLGLYFRKKGKDNSLSGGPFYYIYYGLKWRWLAYVAALFTVLAAIGMSGAQTNKISGTIANSLGSEDMMIKLIVGIVVALLVGIIIVGGIKRIGKVASLLVPFMSLLFIILAFVGIGMHIVNVPAAFAAIFSSAFGVKALAGGVTGYIFSVVIKKGMARGVFSNEAGLGSSVIAHSASETKEPVKQGLWGIFEVFFDTFIVCTITALLVLTSVDLSSINPDLGDTAFIMDIFKNNFGVFGTVTFAIILPLFAFTTIMAWSYYGEKATGFLCKKLGEKGEKIGILVFKIIYVLLIVASAVITSSLAWEISDTFNGLMAIPNLISVVALSGLVVKITKNYFDRKKGKEVEPMLSAYEDLNEEFKKTLKEEMEDSKEN
ncbi:MAG: sodium:alanine symporter family protein [Bacilli bacterium]|nr:sodium:alanine symporter family protein [Bacilli bacterium]